MVDIAEDDYDNKTQNLYLGKRLSSLVGSSALTNMQRNWYLEIKDKLLFTMKRAIIDNFYLVSGHWNISAAYNLLTTPAMVPISFPRVDSSTGRY